MTISRRRVGIEKINAYPCTLSLDMEMLAKARGADPAHPRDELWVDSRSLNPVWEDPITMAVNAALGMLSPEDRELIELIIVGTESSPDFGKPMSTYVQRFCGIQDNCRNFETKHACYGGTSGLMMAAHWVASGVRPGKKALVVMADQSRTHLGKPWEYVLGAGACALLVSEKPDVIELELENNGYWTQEIADTYRPTSRSEVGHADTSLFGYLDAVEGSFSHFLKNSEENSGPIDYDGDFKKHIYHVPFGGMAFRAHKAVMRRVRKMPGKELRAHYAEKSAPSLTFNRLYGGTYTAATFIALMGMIDACDDLVEGDRLTIFSYGSGSCSEFYSAKLGPRAREIVKKAGVREGLAARRSVTLDEYETIEKLRSSYIDQPDYETDKSGPDGHYAAAYEGKGRLVLDGVSGFERQYRLS